MNAITTFINESLEELRHVRWPTRQQAIRLSIIVIGFCLVTAAFFGAVDFVLAELTKTALDFAS